MVESKKHWTKKIKPGLLAYGNIDYWSNEIPGVSTFGDKPDRVGPDHLKELFDHAIEIIPDHQLQTTPIFLLATAGMRLLPDNERKELLKEICSYTKATTKLMISDCNLHIQVIPGETEGLYGWIAANYLLGGFDSPRDHAHGQGHHTYGFLDMGGASAQIAFAPNSTEAEKHADNLKLIRFRNVKGVVSEYKVFVTTWLEFGVHEARRRYIELLMKTYGSEKGELPDPCLPKSLTMSTKGDILTPDKINGEEVHLIGTGEFQECLKSAYPLLNKELPCPDPPCLLNGGHAPAIDFGINHFVGVSEYWHTTHEIFETSHKDKAYDLKTYQQRVSDFCSQPWQEILEGVKEEKWGNKVKEATTSEVCFKASWLINVLHDGIGIPRVGLEGMKSNGQNGTKEILDGVKEKGFTDAFQPINKIDDTEVSWTLGRMVLYAASEIPPTKTNTLPVGFGPNVKGVPPDFQLAGIYHPPRPNATNPEFDSEPESWRDTLFEGRTPRRIPGFLLFMLIVCIAVFLLCGKDRRSRLYHKLFSHFKFGRPGRRGRGGIFAPKPLYSPSTLHHGASERLLESGIHDPDDFELGSLDGAEDDSYSDDSGRSKNGRTSGWATPRLRTPKTDSGVSEFGGHVGNGIGLGLGKTAPGNAMDRSGLFVRTDSRERLSGLGLGEERTRPRSRRGSPTRFKSPLMGTLVED